MDIKTIIRTSAIIYADETSVVSTKTIQRKFIEAVFIDNGNNALEINDLLTEIEMKFNLSFSVEETLNIVNKSNIDYFYVQHSGRNIESTLISLSGSRYSFLKSKEITNSFEKFTNEFSEISADCKKTENSIDAIIYKYLYELLNTNIQLYSNILIPKNQQHNFTIDSTKFSDDEICIINEFLSWENSEKNKALFKIVSYCIEYALVANHTSSDNTYLASLRNKLFYLDNNIIYRALGINGDVRKKRTLVFLKKCIESGQKLLISKYSKKEFIDTVEYHINQLKKLPYGRINPRLFSKFCLSPSFYEFYHNWRNGRITYGFDSFQAYVLGEYDHLRRIYYIEEDYKIPFDERNQNIISEIEAYRIDIQDFKAFGYEESHRLDALNCYMIEKKRGNNNINIQDTKYYLITTDQKLRKWDDYHSKNQSITLLPSHWMGLLLKYFSRSDDDFKSFVSFLKLKQHDDSIDEHTLQIILSGISEITEDFIRQDTIMERMVERKFAGIFDNKNPTVMREEAKKFAKEVIEDELEKSILSHNDEIKILSEKYESDKQQIFSENKTKLDELYEKIQQEKQQEKYELICKEINRIKKAKENAEARGEEDFHKDKFKFAFIPIVVGLVLFICVLQFDWNIMQRIIWIVSALLVGLTYAYLGFYGKSFNPVNYFIQLKEKKIRMAYLEFLVDLNEFYELEQLKREFEERKSINFKKR